MTDAFWRRFLIPGALWLLLFFLVPFGIAVLISLGENNDFGGVTYGWNPSNYADALDPLFAPVLLRSVGYAAATAVLCLLIGYPVAYCIARFGGRRRNLLIAAILAPFLINYLVRTYAWVALLADEGLVNRLITDSGLSGDPVQFLNTPWAVIGGLVYGYLGFMILPIYASLERMDPALIEAGKDLYGSPRQTFWHVTWPQTVPGVLAGSVLVFLPAVGDFVSAQLLGGPDTYMVGNLIQQQYFGAENWPFGSALTIVLMAFLALFMFFYLRGAGLRRAAGGAGMSLAAERPIEVAEQPAVGRRKRPRGFDRPRTLWVITGLVYTFLFAPILIVILFSFNSAKSLQTFDGFSLRWYREFFGDESLRDVAVHVDRDRRRHHGRRRRCSARRWRWAWRGRARGPAAPRACCS